MATLEERVAHIEKFMNVHSGFEPIPDPRYVTVVLDEALERSAHVKQYTYEDVYRAFKVGDRVSAPVGTWGGRKAGTVVRVDVKAPIGVPVKPLHQFL